MGQRNRIDTTYIDYFRIIEPLLQSGWTSYLDMLVAILNDPLLSARHIKYVKYKETIKKDPVLLNRFKEYEKSINKKTKGLSVSVKEYAGLYEGIEQYVELLDSPLYDYLRKTILPKMFEKQSQMQHHTKTNSTKQLFINVETLHFLDSIENLSKYNLRPETIRYINFIKEIQKIKDTTDHVLVNEMAKIKAKYGYSDKGLDKSKFKRFTRYSHEINVYRYNDPSYSLIDDLEKKDTEGNLRTNDCLSKTTIDLINKIPGLPSESIGNATFVDLKLKELIEYGENVFKSNRERRNVIKQLCEKRPSYWTKDVNNNYAAIIGDSLSANRILPIFNKKIDLSNDIENYHIHRLKYPNPEYLPSDFTSIIIHYDDYCDNIQRNDYGRLFEYLKELSFLLKKKDLEINDFKRIGELCFFIDLESFNLICFLHDEGNTIDSMNFKKLIDAVKSLYDYIGDLMLAHKIIEALVYYRSKPDSDISEIAEPINRLVSSEKKYFALLDKKTGLTEKCIEFVNNTEKSVTQNKNKLCAIAILLDAIKDDYQDSYHILYDCFYTEEIETIFSQAELENEDVIILVAHWHFEAIRRATTRYIKEKINIDYSYNLVGGFRRMINSLYAGAFGFRLLSFDDLNELKEDVNELTSIITRTPNNSLSERMLILLDAIKYIDYPRNRSINVCEKEMILVINNAKEKKLERDEMQLLYYCLSFNVIDTISFNIQFNKRRTEQTILRAFNWLKKNIIDKIDKTQWDVEKDIIKEHFEHSIVFAYKVNFRKEEFQYNYQDW